MTVAIKQSSGTTGVQSGAGTTTMTCTLPAPPTVGNLLVFLMAGDKDTGALTLPGFTQQHVILGADASLYYCYRVSDGTEQTILPVWANVSVAGNTAWYAELEDTAITGSTYWQVSASAASAYSASAVQARSTNITDLITHEGLAIGAWGMDNGGNVAGGTRVYEGIYIEKCTSHLAGLRGGIFAASRNIGAGVVTQCAFSYSGLGTSPNVISGCVAVFSKLVSVAGNSTGAFSVRGAAPAGAFSVRDGSSGGWEVIGESGGAVVGKGDSEGNMAGLGSSSGTFTKGV